MPSRASVPTWALCVGVVVLLACVVVAALVLRADSSHPDTFVASDSFAHSAYAHGINNVNSNVLANHKVVTSRMLQLNNIPCPKFVHVYKLRTPEHLDALVRAYDISYPVVVKPVNGNQGKRVFVNLQSPEQVHHALSIVLGQRARGKPVDGAIVEEQVVGQDFRVLMLNHKVFDVVCRVRATVVGDGSRTLGELIARRNRQQRREGRFPTKSVSWGFVAEQLHMPVDPSRLDNTDTTLQYMLLEHVIPAGKRLTITNVANNHNGCNPVRVPIEQVHPDNIALFERISKLFGLRMSGIDYMTPDIATPHTEMGHVIEVNSGPGMAVHRSAYPKDRGVVKRVMRELISTEPQKPYE